MENIFSDINTYMLLHRNSITKLIDNLKKTLKRWLQSKYISDKVYSRLNSSNANLLRALFIIFLSQFYIISNSQLMFLYKVFLR